VRHYSLAEPTFGAGTRLHRPKAEIFVPAYCQYIHESIKRAAMGIEPMTSCRLHKHMPKAGIILLDQAAFRVGLPCIILAPGCVSIGT
jgi:hypothetical protein